MSRYPNFRKNNKQNDAFTLIEISIAVIIIGLIVGGVIGGRSLINSAKINSVIQEIEKYRVSIKAFKLEYDALPGDMTDATEYWGQAGNGNQCQIVSGTGTETCNGDGDKQFEYVNGGTHRHEPWRAWQHLSNAKILHTNYSGISGSGDHCYAAGSNYCAEPGINAPKSDIGNGASWNLFHSNIPYNTWTGKRTNRNFMALGSNFTTTGNNLNNLWYGMVLTPKQMKSIDKKTDDGLPNKGSIVNMNINGQVVGGYNPNCTIGSNDTMAYNLSYTNIACNLFADIN